MGEFVSADSTRLLAIVYHGIQVYVVREVGNCLTYNSTCKLYIINGVWPYAHQKVSTVEIARQSLIFKKRIILYYCRHIENGVVFML